MNKPLKDYTNQELLEQLEKRLKSNFTQDEMINFCRIIFENQQTIHQVMSFNINRQEMENDELKRKLKEINNHD